MTSRASAARFARALFDVVLAERGDLVRVARELADFATLVSGNEPLHRALTSPAIPASRKRAVLEQLLRAAGGLSPQLGKLLLMMADRDRLVLLPELVRAYEHRLMDHQQVIRAEVVTPVPLPADRASALEAGLARATGRRVQLETRVDPAIIGGAVARIGSTVYDGSITRQLEKMRESLVSAAE